MKFPWKIVREVLNSTIAKLIVALLAAFAGGNEIAEQVQQSEQPAPQQ